MSKEECWTISNSHEDEEAQYPILVVCQAIMIHSFPPLSTLLEFLPIAALCRWCCGASKGKKRRCEPC